ncbi:hypothetical protein CTI12_AA001800 [Artemisia annua]|uniref:Uncharacterized protein n=1 Tax=Artemisia annua TaxID=35608 RepID=A0A2U1QPJ5_ARTAN|nr:hypothetical protein CTI12_AA001800 [Artemisia annua]
MEERGRGIYIRRNSMSAAERVRRWHKPYDGPPPAGTMDAFLASKGFKPQPLYPLGYENRDPAALAYLPEFIRTSSSLATSGTLKPLKSSTSSSSAAAATGTPAQVKGGTVPNKSSETLVENLKLEENRISN